MGLLAGILEAFFNGLLQFALAFWIDNLKTPEQAVDDEKGAGVDRDVGGTP